MIGGILVIPNHIFYHDVIGLENLLNKNVELKVNYIILLKLF